MKHTDERPVCACHGRMMYKNNRPPRWTCAVLQIQSVMKYEARNLEKKRAHRRKYGRSIKGVVSRRKHTLAKLRAKYTQRLHQLTMEVENAQS